MQKKLLEIKTLIKKVKENGSVFLQAGRGLPMKWTKLSSFTDREAKEGVCLLFDLYQLRSIAPAFSDISLDIIDWAEEPIIFHTPVSPMLKSGPISKGIIKFALIKEPFWNKMLFASGQILVCQEVNEGIETLILEEPFPLQQKNVKEMYLSADGQVKIIKP
ncbi:hypothetical protein [Lunatibacter salilacus]|uniref:hypothetical protein n=1 Tax=Lunatibacter salilacus TaxID=2483804 RepID=UPI00131A7507|nr:hypothetical protein [Lunatibacter salilacus]